MPWLCGEQQRQKAPEQDSTNQCHNPSVLLMARIKHLETPCFSLLDGCLQSRSKSISHRTWSGISLGHTKKELIMQVDLANCGQHERVFQLYTMFMSTIVPKYSKAYPWLITDVRGCPIHGSACSLDTCINAPAGNGQLNNSCASACCVHPLETQVGLSRSAERGTLSTARNTWRVPTAPPHQ